MFLTPQLGFMNTRTLAATGNTFDHGKFDDAEFESDPVLVTSFVDGTFVTNNPLVAGTPGEDSHIQAYDGETWLNAQSLDSIDSDTPGAGETTFSVGFA